MQLHVLAALTEFERVRIAERVRSGLAPAKQQGSGSGGRRNVCLSASGPAA
ncbi:MAG: recombinase family protein [Acidobacteriota bacterium]|nr:recombinase family protein [Acidobacteriota bacterium]